jgi:hypothetical protein
MDVFSITDVSDVPAVLIAKDTGFTCPDSRRPAQQTTQKMREKQRK